MLRTGLALAAGAMALAACGGGETSQGAGGASASSVLPSTGTEMPSGSTAGPSTTTAVTVSTGGTTGGTTYVLEEGWEDGDAAWTIEGPAVLETDPSRVRTGATSLRVDFRDPACGASSCNADGNNCYESYPQVVSRASFDLERYYASWWVYYPADFTFYDGPCMPVRGAQGHFVRFANFHTPHDPNDSFYQAGIPDFGQNRSSGTELGIRAEWQWTENATGVESIGRNLKALPIAHADLAGRWNRYEIFVDLGAVGGADGGIAWSVNDQIVFDIHDDALHVGVPFEDWDTWGTAVEQAKAHPGMLRTTPEGFTRLGLVSNPNSSFGGRPGDVYWIDDLQIAEACPADRPVCAAFTR